MYNDGVAVTKMSLISRQSVTVQWRLKSVVGD